ncbi:hypothetical protein NDU88_002358 [Pleurodeles waltl]|uniref:Uncharacterized protein n=1 Tax=Pleurodeles waltl TaxID=8319 RepID=A0AAV7UZJ1_PLEWA|nr:hypothetical protein NDU88_002358 [Pleurodeles waltl]
MGSLAHLQQLFRRSPRGARGPRRRLVSSPRCPARAWRSTRGSAPAKPGPCPPHRLRRESVCWGEDPPGTPALAGRSGAFNAAGRPRRSPCRTRAVRITLAAARCFTRGRGSKRGGGASLLSRQSARLGPQLATAPR